jgi:hypothetical protein
MFNGLFIHELLPIMSAKKYREITLAVAGCDISEYGTTSGAINVVRPPKFTRLKV